MMAVDIIGKGRCKAMLILKYDRKDFFNHMTYTEDKKNSYTKEDLKKVFAYFSKTHDASIQTVYQNMKTGWLL